MKIKLNKHSEGYKRYLMEADDVFTRHSDELGDDTPNDDNSDGFGDGLDSQTPNGSDDNNETPTNSGDTFAQGNDTPATPSGENQDATSTNVDDVQSQPQGESDEEKKVDAWTKETLKASASEGIRMKNNSDNIIIKLIFTNKLTKMLKMPEIPSNFDTLMSELNMPKKFQNVRGMMPDPEKQIDTTQDQAYYAFGKVKCPFMKVVEKKPSIKESRIFDYYDKIDEGFADHGLYGTDNDNDILKGEDNEQLGEMNENEDPLIAIDTYLTNVMKSMVVLYRTCGQGKQVDELLKIVNELKEASADNVQKWLDDNNEVLKARKQEEMNNLRAKKQAAENTMKLVSQYMSNITKFEQQLSQMKDWNKAHKEIVSAMSLVMRGKKDTDYLDKQIEKNIPDIKLQNMITTGAGGGLNDSVSYLRYKRKRRLLEDADDETNRFAEQKVGKDIAFDADKLYLNLFNRLSAKVHQIMSGDPKDNEEVKWAQQQMEEMKKAATEEITVRIAQVTHMASSDTQGLGGKIAQFFSKHPIRSATLTNLWKRHERDLDERIHNRLQQITKAGGGTPLGFANQFLQEVFPKLVSMMIVYKCILQLFNDERTRCGDFTTTVTQDVEKEADRSVDIISEVAEQSFLSNGAMLSQDGTTNPFTQMAIGSTPYLGAFIANLLFETRQVDMASAQTLNAIVTIVDALEAKKGNPKEFYTTLLSAVADITKCDLYDLPTAFDNAFQALNRKNLEMYSKITNEIKTNNNLTNDAYSAGRKNIENMIYASRGSMLIEYAKAVKSFDGKTNKEIKKLFDNKNGDDYSAIKQDTQNPFDDWLATTRQTLNENENADIYATLATFAMNIKLNEFKNFNKTYDTCADGPMQFKALYPMMKMLCDEKLLNVYNNSLDAEQLQIWLDDIEKCDAGKDEDAKVIVETYKKILDYLPQSFKLANEDQQKWDSVTETGEYKYLASHIKELLSKDNDTYGQVIDEGMNRHLNQSTEPTPIEVGQDGGSQADKDDVAFIRAFVALAQKAMEELGSINNIKASIEHLLKDKFVIGYAGGAKSGEQKDTFDNIIKNIKQFNTTLASVQSEALMQTFSDKMDDANNECKVSNLFNALMDDSIQFDTPDNFLSSLKPLIVDEQGKFDKESFKNIGNLYDKLNANDLTPTATQDLVRTSYVYRGYYTEAR